MKMPAGPLAFESRHKPKPLTEAEEGALVFAACGITGHALADLNYAKDGGGSIMAGLVARTVASGDGLQTVSLVVTNDEATYLIRKPRELPASEISKLIELGQRGEFTELYRRCRVKIKDGRTTTPAEPLFNINANRWASHAPGTSYFLPVNDLTFMYINGLLEILNEHTAAFILDERNNFLPAGLSKFAKDHGGHLEGDPNQGRVATVRQVEQFVTEFVTAEQGMMLQNLGLMAEALGVGGYPNFANHEFTWFQALGFRMQEMPANRYVGAGWLPSLAMKCLKRNPSIPYPVGLERNVLVDIPAAGTYAVTVSSSQLNQGAIILPCAGPCPTPANHGTYFAGTTRDIVLQPGLHRVTTYKVEANDPGVSVEIRPK